MDVKKITKIIKEYIDEYADYNFKSVVSTERKRMMIGQGCIEDRWFIVVNCENLGQIFNRHFKKTFELNDYGKILSIE